MNIFVKTHFSKDLTIKLSIGACFLQIVLLIKGKIV
jgi:hypothetical protein